MTPLAITGLGVVSPIGVGWDAFEAALGDAAVDPFSTECSLFAMAPYEGTRVAEVRGFDAARFVGDKGLRNSDRLTKLYLVAARLALGHAGVKRDGAWTAYGPDDVGVVAANAYGSLEAVHELNKVARLEDPRYLNPARFPNTVINSSLGYVSIWEDLRALNATVVNGPAGSLDAVSCAELYLSAGRAKAALVGGGEALAEGMQLALCRTNMADRAPLAWAPGSPASGGVRAGEGSVLAVMEPLAAARARGATVRAVLTGYGTAFEGAGDDAEELFAPSALALERAIRGALRDAALDAGAVDLVVSGLSGWRPMDGPELKAIRAVFGAGARVAAPKGRVGETFGASGAFGLAAAVAWMRGAPVTSLVRGGGAAAPRVALVTALGFHGNASAVVVRRADYTE